jgi:hypothetical protein
MSFAVIFYICKEKSCPAGRWSTIFIIQKYKSLRETDYVEVIETAADYFSSEPS